MKNQKFALEFNEEKGLLTSISLCEDPQKANFLKEGKGFCELHGVPWHTYTDGDWTIEQEGYQFEGFSKTENCATAIFSRRGVKVEEQFILEEDILRVKISVKNTNAYPFYFKREDFSFFVPFADSYDGSLVSQAVRCHTHIAAFLENSWIQAERMGFSEYNLGVLLLKGSTYSYSQENCTHSNDRGYLSLNVSPFSLLGGETYEIELAVFSHKGGEDFFTQAKKFPEYIHVHAQGGFVLEKGEKREIIFEKGEEIRACKVWQGAKKLPVFVQGNQAKVVLDGKTLGEKKITYELNGRKGETYFFVSESLEKLQKSRAHFIVKHQQCLDKNSPLYGAFLIYDNEEKRQYFSYDFTDHNANRERMVMAVYLVKYMRKTGDKSVAKALKLFTQFLLRECLDEETGASFNNIGRAANVVRLYNAPWVVLYFCELYLLTGEERWIRLAIRMFIPYYQNGGTNFYPNGIRFTEMAYAIRKSGLKEEYEKVLSFFDEHIENIIKKGTNYPPHEVKFEQTIVTPAACLLMDKYLLCKEEKYLKEAEKHLKILAKFHGEQPDYRLNAVPLRYWDNFWFGKTRSCVYGDTLPHPALAHSAHCFYTYGMITGQKEWLDLGERCWKSGYCLFKSNGEAFSSFVYPERVNGKKCAFFDPFANEQDGFLYLAYKMAEDLEYSE